MIFLPHETAIKQDRAITMPSNTETTKTHWFVREIESGNKQALKNVPYSLQFLEMCLYSVISAPSTIKYVDPRFLTEEFYSRVADGNYFAIFHIDPKHRTSKVVKAAIANCPEAIGSVEQTQENVEHAAQCHGSDILNYLNRESYLDMGRIVDICIRNARAKDELYRALMEINVEHPRFGELLKNAIINNPDLFLELREYVCDETIVELFDILKYYMMTWTTIETSLVEKIVSRNGHYLQCFHPFIQTVTIAALAVAQDRLAIAHVRPDLRSYLE